MSLWVLKFRVNVNKIIKIKSYVQCKIKQSITTKYAPASGAQVVNQTALKETLKQTCDVFVNTNVDVDEPSGRQAATHLGHVLSDYKQAPVLFDYYSKQLHQVVMSELPEAAMKHTRSHLVYKRVANSNFSRNTNV